MGEDCRTLYPQLHFDRQSPYFSSLVAPPYLGQQDIISSSMNPGTNMVSANGSLPLCAPSVGPHSWAARSMEPHGWLNGLHSMHHAFKTTSNSLLKEKLSLCPNESLRETTNMNPKAEHGYAQKRFLVIDQSGDQTTLMFSSGIRNPGRLASLKANPPSAYNFNEEGTGAKSILRNLAQPILTDECKQSNENGEQSEMHEDTEELNALLYSDNDTDGTDTSDDDEVTSTGHSPSTLSASDKYNWFEGGTDFEQNVEEVASSSTGTMKKRKFRNGDDVDRPSVMDSASSYKLSMTLELEDDAESCCASKKTRKEKIIETVSILQSIIPDGKGKDSMVVLDEAIQYLKLLKHQAKAFGFDAL